MAASVVAFGVIDEARAAGRGLFGDELLAGGARELAHVRGQVVGEGVTVADEEHALLGRGGATFDGCGLRIELGIGGRVRHARIAFARVVPRVGPHRNVERRGLALALAGGRIRGEQSEQRQPARHGPLYVGVERREIGFGHAQSSISMASICAKRSAAHASSRPAVTSDLR